MATLKPDAGMRNLDHYKNKLPLWRYNPRQRLIPFIRQETPYLAWLQDHCRTPVLDSYFAITANLGTHTAFVVMLPILFWFGYTHLGRAIVHVLALGVYWSGFVKDLLCLPRPLSPPIQRITMSGTAALEYGFPSTHSTNAMSVVVYSFFCLHSSDSTFSPSTKLILEICLYWYAVSIIFGRMYCGMHGFFDVVIGMVIGASVSLLQWGFGNAFDEFILNGSIKSLFFTIGVILLLIRVHPEPADDCPCFDDSVCFSGVLIGAEIGNWHYAGSKYSWNEPVPATVPFQYQELGLTISILRVVVGVGIIIVWREIAKPTLLRFLPPLFRVLENFNLNLPRRFFTVASQYEKVPKDLKDDNVIPSVSEIPTLLDNMRHPRLRAISVGPQSEADAYEALAYHEQRRRESMNSPNPDLMKDNEKGLNGDAHKYFDETILPKRPLSFPTRPNFELHRYEPQIGNGTAISPFYGMKHEKNQISIDMNEDVIDEKPDAEDEQRVFSTLEKPRVRYDVEVVTKLVVYTGVAWLAVEGNPILFQLMGLGL